MSAIHRPLLFAAGLGLGLLAGLGLGRLWVSEEPDIAHYREVRDYARETFVRDVSDSVLLDAALHGLADGLDDYSHYYDLGEARELQRETTGRYFGLGVVLARPFREARILFPLPGSPAATAGVRVGDRIVRIGEQPFEDVDEARFRELVGGSEPRDVAFVLEGLDGVERHVTVRTAEVVEPTVRHERMLDPVRGTAYVAVTGFSRETPGEFGSALNRLSEDGMRALVLDLRGNPGGVLVSAVEMANLFVEEGLIVSTEGRGRITRHEAQAGLARYRGLPLTILVDEGTASASEVLAAALQEHGAAVLVGSPTYGKGLVQTLHSFGTPGPVMKVSTSYYYTPSHTNLEHSADPTRARGIQPDLRVSLPPEERARVRERLARAAPAREYREAMAAWERERKEPIVEPIPVDAQVEAAVELFAGKRPGPAPKRGSS